MAEPVLLFLPADSFNKTAGDTIRRYRGFCDALGEQDIKVRPEACNNPDAEERSYYFDPLPA